MQGQRSTAEPEQNQRDQGEEKEKTARERQYSAETPRGEPGQADWAREEAAPPVEAGKDQYDGHSMFPKHLLGA
eukprot:8905537-Prorocentrum_lima.AAC.1